MPYAATYGTMGAFFAGIYDTRVGYSGLSMGYQLGSIFGSALTPIVATALLAAAGTIVAFGLYVSALAVIAADASVWLIAAPEDRTTVGVEADSVPQAG